MPVLSLGGVLCQAGARGHLATTRAGSARQQAVHGAGMHLSEAAADGLLGLCPDGLRIQTDPEEVDFGAEWPVVVETASTLNLVDDGEVRVWMKTEPVLRRKRRAHAIDVDATEPPVVGRHWYWAEQPDLEDAFGAPQRRLAGRVEQLRTLRTVGGTQVVEGIRFYAFPRRVVGDVWVRPTSRFIVHLEDGALWLLDLPAERFYCWPGDGGQPKVYEGVGASHLECGVALRLTVVPAGGAMVDLEVGVARSIVAEVPVSC